MEDRKSHRFHYQLQLGKENKHGSQVGGGIVFSSKERQPRFRLQDPSAK